MGVLSPGFASVSLIMHYCFLASLSQSKPFILVFKFWGRTQAMTVGASVTLESRPSDETLELTYSRAHGDMGSMMGGKLGSDNT